MKQNLVKEKRLILMEKLLVLMAFNLECVLDALGPFMPPNERLTKVINDQKKTLNDLMALADQE